MAAKNSTIKLLSSTGRVVAGVRAGVLSKRISSRHMLRRPPAIAFDTAVIAAAERAGAWRVEVANTDTNKIYSATLAEFRAGAFALDRGFGAQLALPLSRWHTAADGLQLSMWGPRG